MKIFRSSLFISSLGFLFLATFVAFVYISRQNEEEASMTDSLSRDQHGDSSGSLNSGASTTVSGETKPRHSSGEKALILPASNPLFHRDSSDVTEGYWEKYPFMKSPLDVADEDRICYVKVGLTSGSGLTCALGFSYDTCPVDHVKIPAGNLPSLTTHMIHKEFNDCTHQKISRYLFVVGDPLSRIQSWFLSERLVPNKPRTAGKETFARKEKLFLDCHFRTLNQLGGPDGLGANDNSICSKRARKAISGEIGYSTHNMYNYQYYYDEAISTAAQDTQPTIFVMRAEHLKDDWSNIEYNFLGGPRLRSDFNFPRHQLQQSHPDRSLSKKSRANICHALCKEIQVYKRILAAAENLDDSDYSISLKELEKSCPMEARLTDCESD